MDRIDPVIMRVGCFCDYPIVLGGSELIQCLFHGFARTIFDSNKSGWWLQQFILNNDIIFFRVIHCLLECRYYCATRCILLRGREGSEEMRKRANVYATMYLSYVDAVIYRSIYISLHKLANQRCFVCGISQNVCGNSHTLF